VLQNN
jgi:hypothetical protein